MSKWFCGVFAGLASLLLAACAKGDSEPQVGYVDGAINAEDLVPIPGTRWLLAGGLDEPGIPGRLTLIDREAKQARLLFSAESPISAETRANGQEGDPACPGPLPPGKFGAHGIALRPTGEGKGTVYVVNHTGREAVELFALDWSGKEPTIAWTGCIPLPEGVLSNGVTPLPGGRIAVTHMNAPEYFDVPAGRGNPEQWIPKFVAGETTGYAATWGPREGWKKIPGTEGSVPNGIEASPDGRLVYVAIWRAGELRRVDLASGQVRTVKLAFMPDNLRWGDDGKLWTAGAAGDPKAYFDCAAKKGCHNPYSIASLDPATMKASEFAHPDTRPAFGDATAAVAVGGEVWVGSNPTEHVAYFPVRP